LDIPLPEITRLGFKSLDPLITLEVLSGPLTTNWQIKAIMRKAWAARQQSAALQVAA